MLLKYSNIAIDHELETLLPPLFSEDFSLLEKSLINNGFDTKFGRIKIWFPNGISGAGIIIDGHNRFQICIDNDIPLQDEYFEEIYFESKDEVIQWMYENQLARRNLSDVDKYEIVERYNDFLRAKAKQNQIAGGKGLSNMTAVNVRKEKAKMAGVSEGKYYMLCKVMQSGDKETIQQLRKGEVTVSKAYQQITSNAKMQSAPLTPQQEIEKIDVRLDQIDKEISDLKAEKKELISVRSTTFEKIDEILELKYEFFYEKSWDFCRNCRFYIELQGYKEIYVECMVYHDSEPAEVWVRKIPLKYRNDFFMLWAKAHKEEVEYVNEMSRKKDEEWAEAMKQSQQVDEKMKEAYKKIYRALAKMLHPDNKHGNEEAMQWLNQLKVFWGI